MSTSVSRSRWVVMFGGAGREQVVERLSAAGVPIELVVVASASAARLSKAIARFRELGLPTINVSRTELSSVLEKHIGSGMLSIGFPYILPQAILDSFKPALNVHPTLLPKYRGPASGAYILINGEVESGSTVHYMNSKMDSGDIIAQSRIKISPFDTIRSLQRKVYKTEPKLVLKAIQNIEKNIPPKVQNEKKASVFPNRRRPKDSQLDTSKTLEELINYIRACDPEKYPAYFKYQRKKLFIKIWRAKKPEKDKDML